MAGEGDSLLERAELDDLRWLASTEGQELLVVLSTDRDSLVRQTARLRRSHTATRTHLLLEQVELRRRAADKFPDPARLLFTRRGLEQATDAWLASFKARRYAELGPIVDLCSGIGGDLNALAVRGAATGVDRDPRMAWIAQHNSGVAVLAESVEPRHVAEVGAWHLDPDRRRFDRRTTCVEASDPDASTIERLLAVNGAAGLKLAPVAETPPNWTEQAEREWISRQGECRQQVLWFGPLTPNPGRRRATILDRTGSIRATLLADGADSPIPVGAISRWIFEPDAAILAAGLTATLARLAGWHALHPGIGYLTGDTLPPSMLVGGISPFEVVEVLPLDVRKVGQALRQRGIGRLEIKHRGIELDPERWRRELSLRGDDSGVLIVSPAGERIVAILARRPTEPRYEKSTPTETT